MQPGRTGEHSPGTMTPPDRAMICSWPLPEFLPGEFESLWPGLPRTLALGPEVVQVWCARLDQLPVSLEQLPPLLAADEVGRMQQFLFDRHRENFLVSRSLLRVLLGSYLDRPPETIRFRYNEHGKPSLVPGQGNDRLCFNLSHSQGIGLFAFVLGREIGVDVEHIRPDRASAQIARRFFTRREAEALEALSGPQAVEAFFHCWTQKEAYLKATGKGLTLPLDSFDVSVSPDQALLLATRPDPAEADRWQLHALQPVPGHVATVAVAGRGSRLCCRQVPSRSPGKGT